MIHEREVRRGTEHYIIRRLLLLFWDYQGDIKVWDHQVDVYWPCIYRFSYLLLLTSVVGGEHILALLAFCIIHSVFKNDYFLHSFELFFLFLFSSSFSLLRPIIVITNQIWLVIRLTGERTGRQWQSWAILTVASVHFFRIWRNQQIRRELYPLHVGACRSHKSSQQTRFWRTLNTLWIFGRFTTHHDGTSNRSCVAPTRTNSRDWILFSLLLHLSRRLPLLLAWYCGILRALVGL